MTNSVTVTGIKAAGSTLKVASSIAGASNITYNWVSVSVDPITNVATTDVLSSNTKSYKLTDADLTKIINVVASYKNAAGSLASLTADDVLQDLNQAHTGGISIKGATTIGSTLTVASSLKDKDGLGPLHYSWKVGGVDVQNNDKNTYVITSADEGKQISAVVTYTDKHGFAETSNNPLTNKVAYSTVKSSLNDHITATTTSKALSGGLGSDTFIFTTTNAKAFKITDFNVMQGDKIDLSAIDAKVGTGDPDANDVFSWLSSAPTTAGVAAKGVVWFDTVSNTLNASTDSDVSAEFSIKFTGLSSAITVNDLIL